MTVPRTFRPGLLGGMRQRLQPGSFDVDGGVHIPGETETAMRAQEDAKMQGHLLAVAALGTGLGGAGGVHFPEHSASFRPFVREDGKKPGPRRVVQGPVDGPEGGHLRRTEIRGCDEAEFADKPVGRLVEEVGSLVDDLLMDLLFSFSFFGAFLLSGESALGLFEPFGEDLPVFGGRDDIAARGGEEAGQAEIDADGEGAGRKNPWGELVAGEADEPLSAGISPDRAGLDLFPDGDLADAEDPEDVALERKPGMDEGEGIAAVPAL